MTQYIQKNLDRLFEFLVPLASKFTKNTYESLFKEQYEEFKPMLDAIIKECSEASDKEGAIKEYASVLPGKMHALLDEQVTKRKKEQLLVNYNLGMVAYVIPMFRYGRTDIGEEIADQIVAVWNNNGLAMDIQKTTFEEIQGGFKDHLCYITTAVCESLGKEDDCYELAILREYRDEYLAYQNGGADVIREYYDVAPTIVKRINRLENSNEVYQDIWKQYLKPCVSYIEIDKKEECRKLYTEMVHSLRKKYIYP